MSQLDTRHNGELSNTLSHQELRQLLQEAVTAIVESDFAVFLQNAVEVKNLDEVKLHLHTELKLLTERLLEALVPMLMREHAVRVVNHPVPPTQMAIEQLPDILTRLDAIRQAVQRITVKPQITVTPPPVTVPPIELPSITIPPVELPAPQVTITLDPVLRSLDVMLDALSPLRVLSNQATKPLSVRLSDGHHWLQAMRALLDKQERVIQAFATSTGMTVEEFRDTVAPANFVSGQAKVAVTGTAVQLVSGKLRNGVILTNIGTTDTTVGGSTVTAIVDGTGNGYVLVPRAAVSVATSNTNNLYINGTATTSRIAWLGS